jgi:hypothetical protein
VTRKSSSSEIYTSFGVWPRDHYKAFQWLPPVCNIPTELHSRLQHSMFSWLLFWVSSDSPQGRRPNQEIVNHSIWCILLYNYAYWTKKRKCNLLAGNTMVSTLTAWVQHWSIRWQHSRKDLERWGTHLWPGRDLQQPEKIQNKAEPWEVYIRCALRKITIGKQFPSVGQNNFRRFI